jgi:hypothetical protein
MTKNNKKWLVSAQIVNCAGENILLLDMYQNKPYIDQTQYPQYRLFINKNEDMIYNVKDKEWHTQKIETLPGMRYGSMKDYYEMLDKTSEKVIDKYIPQKWTWDTNHLDRVKSKQEENRSKKSSRAYELRVARIKNRMNIVNELSGPDDFLRFVDESYNDLRYAFYKAEGNKRYIQISCSHCKSEHKIDSKKEERPRHLGYGICPECGSRIQYISPGKRQKISESKDVILMQKIEGGFVSRYYDADRESVYGNEYYHIREKARVIYDGKSAKTYYNTNGKYETKEIYWWDRNAQMYSYDCHVTYGKGVLYHKNLNEVLHDTTFRYSALKQLAEHKQGYVINHESFLQHYESNRFIEYFIKMGLYNLANDFVISAYTNAINRAGKNPLEILKISKQQVNRLIEMDGNLYTLRLLQAENVAGKKFTDEEMIYLTENSIDIDRLEKILQYTTAMKAIRYLKEVKSYKKSNTSLIDWNDYLENCKTLEYDLRNEFILFPRHLKEAHDRTVLLVMDIKNKAMDVQLKDFMMQAVQKYKFNTEHYEIVVPNTTSDIVREGQELHHCVGTYVDRVVKGETTILFVREKDYIDQPFYTMEVKNGAIVQVRGKNNKDMTPQVKQFIESFKKKKLNQEEPSYAKGGGNVA